MQDDLHWNKNLPTQFLKQIGVSSTMSALVDGAE